MKIDVDGIEISVLKGMGDILMSKNLQSIMIEANSRIMEDEMRRMLSHYGFKIDRVQNKSWETAKTRNNFFYQVIQNDFVAKWLGPGSNRRPNDFQSFARTN